MSCSQYGDDFMVFSGTANPALAEKVANYLGKPLNKIDIKHFPDGETFCQVIDPVRGKDVFVIQSGSPSPNDAYMELFIIRSPTSDMYSLKIESSTYAESGNSGADRL